MHKLSVNRIFVTHSIRFAMNYANIFIKYFFLNQSQEQAADVEQDAKKKAALQRAASKTKAAMLDLSNELGFTMSEDEPKK